MENDTTKMYNDLYFSMIEWFLQKLFDVIYMLKYYSSKKKTRENNFMVAWLNFMWWRVHINTIFNSCSKKATGKSKTHATFLEVIRTLKRHSKKINQKIQNSFKIISMVLGFCKLDSYVKNHSFTNFR